MGVAGWAGETDSNRSREAAGAGDGGFSSAIEEREGELVPSPVSETDKRGFEFGEVSMGGFSTDNAHAFATESRPPNGFR